MVLTTFFLKKSRGKSNFLYCIQNDFPPHTFDRPNYLVRYSSRGKPYYMYGPRKIETVSKRPHIVVLHDFITPGEAKEIIDFASPNLKRSAMVGNK